MQLETSLKNYGKDLLAMSAPLKPSEVELFKEGTHSLTMVDSVAFYASGTVVVQAFKDNYELSACLGDDVTYQGEDYILEDVVYPRIYLRKDTFVTPVHIVAFVASKIDVAL
jgi:hypothetical protein